MKHPLIFAATAACGILAVSTAAQAGYWNYGCKGNLGDTAIDITMETRGPDHIVELLEALVAAGYTHERIL